MSTTEAPPTPKLRLFGITLRPKDSSLEQVTDHVMAIDHPDAIDRFLKDHSIVTGDGLILVEIPYITRND